MHGFTVILEETLKERLTTVLSYAAWLLDEVDATQRLSHIVIAARITGGFAMLRISPLAAEQGRKIFDELLCLVNKNRPWNM
jgi:hypothetical protein